MERALVIGASGGIGGAVTGALSARGMEVVGLSRSRDGLNVTDEDCIARHLGVLEGTFDLVFVATGALVIDGAEPEKTLRALSVKSLADQYLLNAIGPMLVLKHALPLLPKDRRSVFAAISARVGSIGDNRLGGWYSYRAAKAGLNQLIHGASIELGRSHKQAIAVCLHPGTVETPFTAKYAGGHKTVPATEAVGNLLSVIDRLTTAQSGGFFDYAGREIVW